MNNTDSILDSIKKLLGLSSDVTAFDQDIIIHINTVFGILNQIGCGPSDGFLIEGDELKWSDYIGESTKLEFVKSYIYLKVKKIFDPPSSSSVMDSMNRTIDELEWRIKLESES